MQTSSNRWMAAIIGAACGVAGASYASALETTYGEDPVPTTGFFKDYINLGYGVDPIPRKTLLQRWAAWRASRDLPRLPLFQGAPALQHDAIEPSYRRERLPPTSHSMPR